MNLVPSGRLRAARARVHGDADASVRARRAFFAAGHFAAQASAEGVRPIQDATHTFLCRGFPRKIHQHAASA